MNIPNLASRHHAMRASRCAGVSSSGVTMRGGRSFGHQSASGGGAALDGVVDAARAIASNVVCSGIFGSPPKILSE
jgi:hypothetical protein